MLCNVGLVLTCTVHEACQIDGASLPSNEDCWFETLNIKFLV